ncbi:MAG: PIN domain-containing protein [Verrucomicrobia bacterium]|jgi:predicted nucleic acid-binding protein|nr:PIN domain-containing protein [Verrucomicrobiota bacterium]
MKCFLDANVLFSAANEASNIHKLILAAAQKHKLLSSDYAREEAIRNIRAKRSEWELGFTRTSPLVEFLTSLDQPITGVEIAPKDRPILATAIASQCDYLITGDKKDFGHLFETTMRGTTVLTPLQFAQKCSHLF